MNAATMFAWWGLNLWVPSYLSLPSTQGGVGLSTETMAMFVVAMQVGMWLGYVTFGFISDIRPPADLHHVSADRGGAGVDLRLRARADRLLVLGPFVAFFGTGYFSGFGAVASEIFPTSIRATALGVTYNSGRLLSAVAPFMVGSLVQRRGFGAAFTITAIAFIVAALWLGIPETKGRKCWRRRNQGSDATARVWQCLCKRTLHQRLFHAVNSSSEGTGLPRSRVGPDGCACRARRPSPG